ncbi:hypothetical protein QLL80_004350 [Yersinia enterocolitica]|uniref:Uncharacterized protein n=1 Tax=Yersinia enterocolitica TaxID=630 RepID=A0AAD2V065_YEREN|nr:hypothetical protein [Yersinia enterocolitica]EKN6064357.1 hypothetical protein [Yersinia enterocolitica]ELI8102106.1 hypothetical protein [Yersinia enterocolitica]ELW7390561.1 hypothetical protein [Yersinia enterocolitica]CFB67745.1 Uncharacterised protein [Yersinia enterocolitica]CQQ67976.1 Uncharacterised protein [Yersinia enterocolitica]
MALNYMNLDASTREFMKLEIQYDYDHDNFYTSNYLSPEGKKAWPALLSESVDFDDKWLEQEIVKRGLLAQFHTRRTPSGGTTQAKVPVTAAQTLAEGEFNRLYARGLCSRVVAEGGHSVEAYRARESLHPRPESQAIIGKKFLVRDVIQDLRTNLGVDSSLGVPPGPNSGISVKI